MSAAIATVEFIWNDTDTDKKRGVCVIKNEEARGWKIDRYIPIFTQDRNYIKKWLEPKEEKQEE